MITSSDGRVRSGSSSGSQLKTRQRASARRLASHWRGRERSQLSAAFHFSEAAPELHLSMAQTRTLRAPSYVCRNQPEATRTLQALLSTSPAGSPTRFIICSTHTFSGGAAASCILRKLPSCWRTLNTSRRTTRAPACHRWKMTFLIM